VVKIATFAKPENVMGKLEPKMPNGLTIKKEKNEKEIFNTNSTRVTLVD
jgi:hypothetical protein